jgi:CO dehydrogenase maturation factor
MKIVVSGKGGVGKTTIAGTLARIFSEKGYPVIAVDSDPSMNLHTALGMKNPTPISEFKKLIAERAVVANGVYNLNPRVDDILDKYALEKGRVKLIVMGTIEKGGEGCICPENAFLRALLRHLILKRNEVLILDTEAGLEHLGRKTAEKFDVMLVICEPSIKALGTANRIYELSRQIRIKKIYGIGNKIASQEQKELIKDNLKFETIDFIPFDEDVIKADALDKPLVEYTHSTALKAIKNISTKIKNLK